MGTPSPRADRSSCGLESSLEGTHLGWDTLEAIARYDTRPRLWWRGHPMTSQNLARNCTMLSAGRPWSTSLDRPRHHPNVSSRLVWRGFLDWTAAPRPEPSKVLDRVRERSSRGCGFPSPVKPSGSTIGCRLLGRWVVGRRGARGRIPRVLSRTTLDGGKVVGRECQAVWKRCGS